MLRVFKQRWTDMPAFRDCRGDDNRLYDVRHLESFPRRGSRDGNWIDRIKQFVGSGLEAGM